MKAVDHAGLAKAWQRLAANEYARAGLARDGDPVMKGDDPTTWARRAAEAAGRARLHVEQLAGVLPCLTCGAGVLLGDVCAECQSHASYGAYLRKWAR